MNKFIVRLKGPFNDEIGRHLNNQGCEIVFKDSILPDLIIVETNVSRAEVAQLPFVEEVKKPRTGGFSDQYKCL